jgi:hypothetical protein
VGAGLNFNLATLLIVGLLAAVGLGLYQLEPGFGILFGIVVGPAVLVTACASWARDARVREQRRRAASPAQPPAGKQPGAAPASPTAPVQPLTSGQKVGIFASTAAAVAGSVLIVVGIVAIMIVLAFLALLQSLADLCKIN